MIEFKRVSKRYNNGFLALDKVSLQLAKSELAFLTGHSGAGKSTLLNLIAAIEMPSQGQVFVAGQEVNRLPTRKIPFLRRELGIILQSPNLLMDRTIFDNIALPLMIAGFAYREILQKVRDVLAKVYLPNIEHCYPYELSGGEQQRVAIARAVVNQPSILIADEPTGNLDPSLAAEIMHLFEQFNALGMTILIASHDLSLISSLKYRMLTLSEGQLIHA